MSRFKHIIDAGINAGKRVNPSSLGGGQTTRGLLTQEIIDSKIRQVTYDNLKKIEDSLHHDIMSSSEKLQKRASDSKKFLDDALRAIMRIGYGNGDDYTSKGLHLAAHDQVQSAISSINKDQAESFITTVKGDNVLGDPRIVEIFSKIYLGDVGHERSAIRRVGSIIAGKTVYSELTEKFIPDIEKHMEGLAEAKAALEKHKVQYAPVMEELKKGRSV